MLRIVKFSLDSYLKMWQHCKNNRSSRTGSMNNSHLEDIKMNYYDDDKVIVFSEFYFLFCGFVDVDYWEQGLFFNLS